MYKRQGYTIITESNPELCIVKGRRRGRPIIDNCLTFGMSLYVLLKCKFWISDINAQPKIFKREFYTKLKNSRSFPKDFSLDLFLLIESLLRSNKIHTFEVDFSRRKYGEAKGGGGSLSNRLKLIKRTLEYINNTANKL